MPTMTIPSANMRRLKKLAAEAAAKSSSGGGLPRANLRGRSPPPVPVPRRDKRVALLAPPAACSEALAAGTRVLVRSTPVAASAGAARPAAAVVRAVVVSAAGEDGYLEVVYEGASSLPGEDPFATVRVPRDQIIADTSHPPPVSGSGGAGREAPSPPCAETHENLEARTAIHQA